MFHDYPVSPVSGWTSRPNTGGGWEMQPNEIANWGWQDGSQPQQLQQQYQQQYQQMYQQYLKLNSPKEEERSLLQCVHDRGIYYKMLLLGELSVA